CADRPDRFGADAAIADEARLRANPSLAASRRRGAPAAGRDDRAQRAGAAAVLVVGLDEASPALVRGAFAAPMGMRPASPTGAPEPGQAMISRAAAERIFGKGVSELAVGAQGARVTAQWSQEWRPSP